MSCHYLSINHYMSCYKLLLIEGPLINTNNVIRLQFILDTIGGVREVIKTPPLNVMVSILGQNGPFCGLLEGNLSLLDCFYEGLEWVRGLVVTYAVTQKLGPTRNAPYSVILHNPMN